MGGGGTCEQNWERTSTFRPYLMEGVTDSPKHGCTKFPLDHELLGGVTDVSDDYACRV